MANTLKFKRGLVATIPTAALGEPLFTTDTFDLYIGDGTGNTRFQKYIASGATTQILRGDGSLYTFPLNISSPSNGQVLKYNGTSWVNDSDAGITGSGSSGQVSYWSGSNTQTGSNNLFWDSVNNKLGIGTTALTAASRRLTIKGASTTDGAILLKTNTTADGATNGFLLQSFNTGDAYVWNFENLPLIFGTNNTDRGRFTAGGNFLLNTSTDGGQRLQVIGDAFINGATTITGTTTTSVANLYLSNSTTTLWAFRNNGQISQASSVQSFNLYPQTQGTLGALSTSGDLSLVLSNTRATGGTLPNGVFFITKSNPDTNTSGTIRYLYINHLPANSFAPTSGTGALIMSEISATINQTGGANGITRGLYVNPTLTAAADWRSIEWSNNTGWGLYGAGTANNYMAGSLGIGTTAALSETVLVLGKSITGSSQAGGLLINGTIQSDATGFSFMYATYISVVNALFTKSNIAHYGAIFNVKGASATITNQYGFWADQSLTTATNNYGFYGNIASGTGRWNLYMAGTAANYLAGVLNIGTTTLAGYTLDVNGTARVQGQLTVTGSTTAASAIARGTHMTPTLVAAANNDVLVGLDVNPTFTNGAFTGVSNIGARIGTTATTGTSELLRINRGTGFGYTSFKQTYDSTYFANGKTFSLANDAATDFVHFAGNNTGTITNFYIPNGSINASTTSLTGTSELLRLSRAAAYGYTAFKQSYNSTFFTNGKTFTLMNDAATDFVHFAGNNTGTITNLILPSGSLLLNTTTDAGFKLDVNGTARVQDNVSIIKNGGTTTTQLLIENFSNGASSGAQLRINSDAASGTVYFAKQATAVPTSGVKKGRDSIWLNSVSGDIVIVNDASGYNINFAAGASSTVQWQITSSGDLSAADGENIIVGSTTGTKIGTATSQKIGFWNATPIVQPTTAVAEATFVENSGGTAVNVDSTFAGYTLQQIAQALKDLGILA